MEASERNSARARLWGYGYADFAHYLGLEEWKLRKLVMDGHFNPGDLRQVAEWVLNGVPKPKRGRPAKKASAPLPAEAPAQPAAPRLDGLLSPQELAAKVAELRRKGVR